MVLKTKTRETIDVISDTNTMIREPDMDEPKYELKKCWFCIPFRQAMTTWAILQAGWITYITMKSMITYFSSRDTYSWTVTPMFTLTTIVSLMEISVNFFLFSSTVMLFQSKWENINKNINNYTILKVMAYVCAIAISQSFYICCHSEDWFFYNLDTVRYQMVRDNPITGLFTCVILGYIALVMRSYVIQLGGKPHCFCCRRKEPSENSEVKQAIDNDEKTDNYDRQNLHTVG